MSKQRWLRRVRTLMVRSDSQFEVFENPQAFAELLRSNTLPRLTRLITHEAGNKVFLSAIADWPGIGQLEELVLTDDYYGRADASLLDSKHFANRLRNLAGIWLKSDDDVEPFARATGLSSLRELKIAFVGDVSPAAVARLFSSEMLQRIETLSLSFDYMRNHHMPGVVYRVLADPAVLPRLRTLRTSSMGSPPEFDALRRRFGPRLKS
jgi:hypothetical protein